MKEANVQNSKIETKMNKTIKIYIIQFVCFAVLFLAARYVIVHWELLSGLMIPVASGLVAIVLSPQFKIFKIEGKETVFIAWLFSKKGKPVTWL